MSACIKKPTPATQKELSCPNCLGTGCDVCDKGKIVIDRCPLELIDNNVSELIAYADLMKQGHMPVSGGVLDQSHSFLEGARFVWSEQSENKSDLETEALKQISENQ